MRKILLVLSGIFTMYSCQITERFTLDESGTVTYESELNFTEMMAYMYDEVSKDSLRKIGEFPVDTLISFADLEDFNQLNSDSISDAQREFMKAMNKTKVRLKLDDEEGKMVFSIHEKSVQDYNAYLKSLFESYKKLQLEDPKAANELGQSGLMQSFEIKYDGKNFEKITLSDTSFQMEDDDSTAEMTRQMMAMFTYKLEYHFPKKVKNTSLENASFSLDGKTMTVDVPMAEMMEDPKKFDFIVEFE